MAQDPPATRTRTRLGEARRGEAIEAAISARRDVRHLLEGLESIIALRATAGRTNDIDRMRDLVDDLRAARREASASLRVVQQIADQALHALGGEAPAVRAKTRAHDRAEKKKTRRR
jgi:hypothetical protein